MQEFLSQLDPQTRYGEALALVATQLISAPSLKYKSIEEGMDPKTFFDCSGFVTYIRRQTNDFCGLKTPDNVRHCRDYEIEGDLVYKGTEKRGDMVLYPDDFGHWSKHMGLVIAPGLQIHSPGEKGPMVEIVPIAEQSIRFPNPESIYLTAPHMYRRFSFRVGSWKVWDISLEQLRILAPMINRQRFIDGDERLVEKVRQTEKVSLQLANILRMLKL